MKTEILNGTQKNVVNKVCVDLSHVNVVRDTGPADHCSPTILQLLVNSQCGTVLRTMDARHAAKWKLLVGGRRELGFYRDGQSGSVVRMRRCCTCCPRRSRGIMGDQVSPSRGKPPHSLPFFLSLPPSLLASLPRPSPHQPSPALVLLAFTC